jgi:HNH endonuclease
VPAQRARAFRKLVTLLKPSGVLAMTLRHGPAEVERAMHPVSVGEIERLARAHGAFVERCNEAEDCLGRPDVCWSQLIVRLPDDGTGALPLLRHVVLNDAKSSTYKLALLRAVARIADGAGGMARPVDDDHVAVPLGLVGLNWLRLFKPLIQADLPQSPVNRGCEQLGFAGKGFRALETLSHLDLRIGARFCGETAKALIQALREACSTIVAMPAFYMTYPSGEQIMKARRGAPVRQSDALIIDEAFLSMFGELRVPVAIWRTLVRFDAWIEPALIAEWIRLMKSYAERQGRTLDETRIAQAMVWSEPMRDVTMVRMRALQLLRDGRSLACIWSGRSLTPASLDVDHCLPWAAWPCDDLWNLLPTHAQVNRHAKRNRLPSAELLRKAQEPIEAWWQDAFVTAPLRTLPERFFAEACASLPGLAAGSQQPELGDVFAGVALKRLVLKQDQQVSEWDG